MFSKGAAPFCNTFREAEGKVPSVCVSPLCPLSILETNLPALTELIKLVFCLSAPRTAAFGATGGAHAFPSSQ